MRIGVICEGPSDLPAITNFVGHALEENGIVAKFVQIFPDPDRTRPDGGWGNVLLWLASHPPAMRVARYFSGGLFGGDLSSEPLDAIVVHLDSDVLEDVSFKNYVKSKYNYNVPDVLSLPERPEIVREILQVAAQFSEMVAADNKRHVLAVAVESTETWCIAAFHPQKADYEILRGQDLCQSFMSALERSEGREPQDNYVSVDKTAARRKRFCKTHAAGSGRILQSCSQFAKTVTILTELAAA